MFIALMSFSNAQYGSLQSAVSPNAAMNSFNPFIVSPSQILEVAPNSADCTDAQFPDECRTAFRAAPSIMLSFYKYNITSVVEQAAIVGWMAYVSGEFKYNRNHSPQPGLFGHGSKSTS